LESLGGVKLTGLLYAIVLQVAVSDAFEIKQEIQLFAQRQNAVTWKPKKYLQFPQLFHSLQPWRVSSSLLFVFLLHFLTSCIQATMETLGETQKQDSTWTYTTQKDKRKIGGPYGMKRPTSE